MYYGEKLNSISHLVGAVRHDTTSSAELIEDTFTTVRPETRCCSALSSMPPTGKA